MTSNSKPWITAILLILISALLGANTGPIGLLNKASDTQKLTNTGIWQEEEIPLVSAEAVGPESFAFDPLGNGPYTGISDGRIIKWNKHESSWVNFAVTSPKRDGCEGPHDNQDQMEHICGRPLGLCFNQTNGDLYIADAYMGLLRVGSEGGLATQIATCAQSVPFGFTNSLLIDQSTGSVYFTDSSSRYTRRNHISVVLSGDKSGRLMKYDPQSNQVTILASNLSFPNGVAMSKDGDYILVAETTKYRILKYWTKTSKAGTYETFAQLPGFPDNIKRSPRGGYWVGIHSRKSKLLDWVLSYQWIGNAILKMPFDLTKIQSVLAKYSGGGMGIRLGENGEILEIFQGRKGNSLRSVSEVMEEDGKLWIGSIHFPFAVRYNM